MLVKLATIELLPEEPRLKARIEIIKIFLTRREFFFMIRKCIVQKM